MTSPSRRDTPAQGAGPAFGSAGRQTVLLGYGGARIPFEFDPGQFSLLAPHDAEAAPLSDEELNEALSHPLGTPPLEELIGPADRVVIVVPDATRAAAAHRVAPLLVRRLRERGLAYGQLSVLVGGGIHRPPTDAEIRTILGPDLPSLIDVHAHDAADASAVSFLGVTSRGTPVEINRRLVEADRVLVVGAISFHYVAGFSGGRKAILPGCAAERSIQANHLLSFNLETLAKRDGVTTAALDGNAVHEDMEEAVAMLDPTFLVNTVVDEANEPVAVYAGHWREAHRSGCDQYKAAHAVPVAERRRVVVVSAGGAPRDVNLIQSHKAMEHAAGILEEGGTLIALAECVAGLGRDDFLTWFVPGGSRGTALRLVDNYKINGQTAWGLRWKSERFRVLLVSSLDPAVVRRMGLEPHATLASALAEAPAEKGYVIPGGLTTLPSLSVG